MSILAVKWNVASVGCRVEGTFGRYLAEELLQKLDILLVHGDLTSSMRSELERWINDRAR
ncbi:MAG: hypothetical protein IPM54_36635 [Polyangiaceae bacterium]|nr:hypothetical protein [Polyangiaceae bacterium]